MALKVTKETMKALCRDVKLTKPQGTEKKSLIVLRYVIDFLGFFNLNRFTIVPGQVQENERFKITPIFMLTLGIHLSNLELI